MYGMTTPRGRGIAMALYGVFLVVCGLIGYKLTGGHSASAIFNGGLFGGLLVILGALHAAGRTWTHPAALSASAIFTLTFLWRAGLFWFQVAVSGNHVNVAVLLSVMAIVSGLFFWLMYRQYRH